MRAREFIVEYDRGMTLKSWEQKLTARMASDESAPDSIDEIMEMIESADPTRNKMYAQWIVKRYVAGDFAADNLDQVNLRLTDYDSVKKSLTSGKDINQLTYAQLPDIISAGRAQKTAPKFETIPDTEVLYNGPDGQLAIPKTEEASRALGKGTAWCTSYSDRDTMFDHYNSSGKLYTWRAKNGNKFQFYWGDRIQFMNSANLPLSPKDMHFFRSINPPTKQLFAEYEDEFLNGDDTLRVLDLIAVLEKSQAVWKEGLALISSDPELAYSYAEMVEKRFPEGEAAIATDAYFSFAYAKLIGEPFPLGEKAIATNAGYSVIYAKEILGNKPFPLGEKAIATSDEHSVDYAEMLDKPFPAGEPVIATSAGYSFAYAQMLRKPFPAGEPAIATSAKYSLKYAEMLDNPFPAGEKAIATNAEYSLRYADLLGKRFPAGEPVIAKDARNSVEYAKILGKPFLAGETAIATDAKNSVEYAEIFSKPFPAGEPAIAKYAYDSFEYARILGKPFPAGEPVIATNRLLSFKYAKILKKRFPAGEAAIATNATYAKEYDEMFGTNLSQE